MYKTYVYKTMNLFTSNQGPDFEFYSFHLLNLNLDELDQGLCRV